MTPAIGNRHTSHQSSQAQGGGDGCPEAGSPGPHSSHFGHRRRTEMKTEKPRPRAPWGTDAWLPVTSPWRGPPALRAICLQLSAATQLQRFPQKPRGRSISEEGPAPCPPDARGVIVSPTKARQGLSGPAGRQEGVSGGLAAKEGETEGQSSDDAGPWVPFRDWRISLSSGFWGMENSSSTQLPGFALDPRKVNR